MKIIYFFRKVSIYERLYTGRNHKRILSNKMHLPYCKLSYLCTSQQIVGTGSSRLLLFAFLPIDSKTSTGIRWINDQFRNSEPTTLVCRHNEFLSRTFFRGFLTPNKIYSSTINAMFSHRSKEQRYQGEFKVSLNLAMNKMSVLLIRKNIFLLFLVYNFHV